MGPARTLPQTTKPERAAFEAARRPGAWQSRATSVLLGFLIPLIGFPIVALTRADTNRPLAAVPHIPAVVAAQDLPTVGGSGHDMQIVVEGQVTEADAEAVRWARDRFLEADLPLPAMQVTFHEDTEPCNGGHGGFKIEDGVSRVLVCASGHEIAREAQVKRTLLHEFAHAWDHLALTDEIRAEFMRFQGSDGWLSESGLPYHERAGEHAAETIMWGLMDKPILMGTLSEPSSWDELYHGYLLLTGSEPPHGYAWSLFAVTPSHQVYAHTPRQLELVQQVWDRLDDPTNDGRHDTVQIRFHRDPEPCAGATTRSQLVDGQLHIRACPASPNALTRELLRELGGR